MCRHRHTYDITASASQFAHAWTGGTNMKTMRKVLAAAAAIVTAMSMTACSTQTADKTFDPDAAAATYGSKTITMREANFMLRYQEWIEEQSSAYMNQYYQYYGYENMWAAPTGIGNKTIGDYFKEVVMSQLLQTYVINDHAAEVGVELTDLQKTAISDTVARLHDETAYNKAFWNYTDATDEQITEWLTANAIAVLVNNKITDEAEVTVTDEEVKSFTINYITVAKDATNETEAPETEEETDADVVAEDADVDAVADSTDAVSDAADAAGDAAAEGADAVSDAAADAADAVSDAAADAAGVAADSASEGADAAADSASDVADAAGDDAAKETTAETVDYGILKGEALADKVLELINAGSTPNEAASAMNNLYSSSQSYRFAEDDEEITSNVLFSEGSKLTEGQAVKVKNGSNGWYVIYCSSDDDALAAEDARTSLTEEKKDEVFNAKYAEWAAAAPKFSVSKNWDNVTVGDFIYVEPGSATETNDAVDADMIDTANDDAAEVDDAVADAANDAVDADLDSDINIDAEADTAAADAADAVTVDAAADAADTAAAE